MKKCFPLFFVIFVVFAAAAAPPPHAAAGLYGEKRIESVPVNDVTAAIAYVNASPGRYTLLVGADVQVAAAAQTIGSGVDLTIQGIGRERVLEYSGAADLPPFFISGSLTLGENITLRGIPNGTTALVHVWGGSLFMEKGSKITGHRNTRSGGGAHVAFGGRFCMNGGEISGNRAESGGGVFISGAGDALDGAFIMNGGTVSGNAADKNGGGVYVGGGGTFRISNGTVHGSDAAAVLRNSASSGAALYVNGGTAERGTFDGSIWSPEGSLATGDNTISGAMQ